MSKILFLILIIGLLVGVFKIGFILHDIIKYDEEVFETTKQEKKGE